MKVLELKTPTPAAERLFEAGFNAALDRYRLLLTESADYLPSLPNNNFDTGEPTTPAKLLGELWKQSLR